jgi:superfamily II DNA/RNA helicase
MSFNELGLSEAVVKAVTEAGYTTPTDIQREAIPHVLARRDVLGLAQTGTGKTAAFTLPMITMLETGRSRARMPRTLILEPTRELAAQVEENFIKYGKNHKLNVALLIGGVSFGDQDAKITRGVDVLIATPGRLLDHFERGKLLLTGVELLVIDEADRMLDMGFIPDIERICKMVPFTRQTLLFTATMPKEIQSIADTFLSSPVRVEVARASSTAATITQRLIASAKDEFDKREVLRDLIRSQTEMKNGIIFCNRKTSVATLHKSLVKHGFSAVALHGDMDQKARMEALDAFKNNEAQLLVASDVAARGLDIPDVSHVFNFDISRHAEDYVHRIGRTGRAGRSGAAFSIITTEDAKQIGAIEELIKTKIEWHGEPLNPDAPPARRPRDENFRPRAAKNEAKRGGRSRGDRPREDKPREDKPKDAKPREYKIPEAKPRDDKPREYKIREAKPREDKPQYEKRANETREWVQRPVVPEKVERSELPAFLLRPITRK